MISQFKSLDFISKSSKLFAFILAALTAGIFVFLVIAQTSYAFVAEDIIGGSQFKQGSLVSIKEDEPGYVELADVDNASRLYGVIQDGSAASVRFANNDSQVSVATSGEVVVFVSDANGEINQGDIVGASWIKGVGMRVDTSFSGRYLGVALEGMSSISTKTYPDIQTPDGKKDVKVGALKVRILSGNLEGRQAEENSLQKLAGSLTGREVSATRVAVAFLLFIISLTLCGVFITNAIRGSFLSIGRNPLASASIYSSLVQVSVMSMIIIVIGAAVAYIVLVV